MSMWLREEIQVLSWKPCVKVAIAIIPDQNNRILVTQRPLDVALGGLWEFPGGKVEPYETPQEALVREIKEELGIEILDSIFTGLHQHAYADIIVELYLFHVTHFMGTPRCLVGQLDMQWMKPDDMKNYEFPAANQFIIDKLRQNSAEINLI
jgi:8-oxo-dGTP diphosphatase